MIKTQKQELPPVFVFSLVCFVISYCPKNIFTPTLKPIELKGNT